MKNSRSISIHAILLAIFLTAAAVLPSSAAHATNDIVFDLDQTLIYKTTAAMAAAEPKNVFVIGDEIYRFSDHAVDLVVLAHELPGSRISYFSGGSAARNQAVLEHLYQEVDRRTQAGLFHPYKVLNKEDLSPQAVAEPAVGAPPLRFWQRYKKDLSRFFDLKSVVIVDDLQRFVPDDQAANIIWIGETYNDRPRFELQGLEDQSLIKKSAPSRDAWQNEREKLVRVADVLKRASEMTERSPVGFTQAVGLVQGKASYLQGLRLLNGLKQRACKALFARAI